MFLCARILPLLVISASLWFTSSRSIATTEYSLFVVSDKPVKLIAKNITKNSATLKWNLSDAKRSMLKAMRINCTRMKSLVEPYIIESGGHMLFNPSPFKSNITIENLLPASRYVCNLIGALSLELGQEKLTLLSRPVAFSTLLEKSDRNFRVLYGLGTLKIIFGGGVPIILVIIAIILLIIGYKKYKKMLTQSKDKRSEKYQMYMPKLDAASDNYLNASKRDVLRPVDTRISKQRKERKKAPQSSTGIHKINPVSVYNYRELANSSNDEDNDLSCDEMVQDIGTELAWDPRVLRKPIPVKGQTSPIQTKPIDTRELSSPSVRMKQIRQYIGIDTSEGMKPGHFYKKEPPGP